MNEKYQLIKKLSNPTNQVVLEAIDTLRKLGWLTDGSLANANLRFSHIQNANLQGADLQKANLNMADMRWANLSQVNLQGACLSRANLYQADLQDANLDGACLNGANLQCARNLQEAQLARAHSLLGATLPDGSRYDGRYHLEGDLQCAQLRHVNLEDSKAMASFYGIMNPNSQNNDHPETGLHGNNIGQLVRKLRSSDSKLVARSVAELRKRGRLSDGTLAWSNLRYVHLANVNLSTANLQNADLSLADLRSANLSYAHLEGTRLFRANLRQANFSRTELKGAILSCAILQGAENLCDELLRTTSRLRGAMMPDGSRYDGRFNLPGDLSDAHCLGVDLQSTDGMAKFYGITQQDYEDGQQWAQVNLPKSQGLSSEMFQVDAESFLSRLSEHDYVNGSEKMR